MHILNLRRLVFHSIFATNSTEKSVCGVADNTNTFILLLFVSFNCNVAFCFCQGITSLRDGITYHNMTLGSHLREKICAILRDLYIDHYMDDQRITVPRNCNESQEM